MGQEWGETAQTIENLAEALDRYDWGRAQAICGELVGDIDTAATSYPEKPAKQILTMLRRKRRFALMELVADAMLRGGQTSAEVRRQYAQCLIDQGKFSAAQAVLDLMIADPQAPPKEKAEARGLMGRIFKQLYVNSHDPGNPRQQANLRQAAQQYYEVYKTEPKVFLWHGINTVACLARAGRDKIETPGFPAPDIIAKGIDSILQAMDEIAYWDRATAIENSVALGDWKAAYDHCVYYLADPKVDAFEIGSLLRQLTELWGLTNDQEPGSTLLPTLKAALLKKEGGSLVIRHGSVSAEAVTAEAAKTNLEKISGKKLEKVFGAESYQPLKWYETGMKRCKAVARIDALNGKHVGTGFLVKASDFFPARSEKELLLLTNAHVISPDDRPHSGALPPEAAVATFEANNETFSVGEVIWSSPPEELDATFVTVEALTASAELCPLKPPAAPFDISKQQRVYVIGYPEGGGLAFSLQDSVWLDTNDQFMHYRTPTNPGSSGSPVFDEEYWTLIALHHAGDEEMPRLNGEGTYKANEGVAISAILKATNPAARNQQFKATS